VEKQPQTTIIGKSEQPPSPINFLRHKNTRIKL